MRLFLYSHVRSKTEVKTKLSALLFVFLLIQLPGFSQVHEAKTVGFEAEINLTEPNDTTLKSIKGYKSFEIGVAAYEQCPVSIPADHYILGESFFANLDNVLRRVALLQAYGFKEATYIHTTCQNMDIDKSLYVVLIKGPVRNKMELYPEMAKAYQKAVEANIKLITTRIVHIK